MQKTSAAAIIFLALATNNAGASDEYFGEFSQGPEGVFLASAPRTVFQLKKSFSFVDPNGLAWTAPADTKVDGATIPRALWSIVGSPFTGRYLPASIIHDYYCDTEERTEHDTHRNFYYGMRANGVPEQQAYLMYFAVEVFGPSWRLEKRVITTEVCSTSDNHLECVDTPEVKNTYVSIPPLNLEDPELLAIAQGKLTALGKNLTTSDGAIFDITAAGVVLANIDSVEANANQMRQILASKSYITSPEQLGIISTWDGGNVWEGATWTNQQLPSFTKAPTLTDIQRRTDAIGTDYYKVTPTDVDNLDQQLFLGSQSFQIPTLNLR